jgi:hypothetical protein
MCYLIKGKPAVLSWILRILRHSRLQVVEGAVTFLCQKYRIDTCHACIKILHATLYGIEKQRSIKQEGLLIEKKNLLGTVMSLFGNITGGLWI